MQKRLFIGRTLSCNRCAKPFAITEETPDPVPAARMRGNSPIPQSLAYPPPPPPATTQSTTTQSTTTQSTATQSTAAPGDAPAPVAAPTPPSTAPVARPAGDGLTAGRMALLIAVVVIAVGFLLYLAISPSVHRAREAARRATCASNLMQVGLALQRYTSNNAGRFPDSLDALVLDGSLPPELLVCPSSNDTVAAGTTPAEQAANLAKGGHDSYVYAGKGKRLNQTNQLIAYEPLADHENEGVNVLYSDGSVQFLNRSTALLLLPQLAAPAAPPAPAATQPAATTTLPTANGA
jgi:hypothetical protein